MSRVSVKDFSFSYLKEQRSILSDINLSFTTDERILILGPSGGGKSTLLLALLRLYTAYDIYYAQGEITYDSRPAADLSRRELLELFGVVFQSPSHQFCLKFPDDEAAFGLENLRIDSEKMQGLIDSSFDRFGFVKRDHNIYELSGGEQQVLAAASTSLLNSKMLVMDEPTAHLDPTGRKMFRSAIQSWMGDNKGFLLVEHHIDLWIDLIGRVIVMDEKGQILFDEKGVDVLCRERSLLSKMGVWLPKQRIYSTGVPVLSSFRINTEIYGPPAIEFRDAYIGYDKKTVVRKLNLQVKKGEFVALVGRNGCGKSTVLQSLIGLSDLQSGSILIEGKKRKKELPAYLFQNPEHQFIYPTVAEEVSDSSVLRRHGLYDKRCQNPFTLSGGEKRRLSLVSLVGSGHSTYLLDEPTFGQDSKTACELVIVIKEFYKKGKTIVLVSHDLPLFRDMLTRVVVLKDGSVVFDGSAQELSGCTATQLESWGVEL